MTTFKDEILACLQRLSASNGNGKKTLAETEVILSAFLKARVTFKEIPRHTHLENALAKHFAVEICVEHEPGSNEALATAGPSASTLPARSLASPLAQPTPDSAVPDSRYEKLIRELDERIRQGRFLWAGFLVKELLPQLGFASTETHAVVQSMEREGLISLTKVPHPEIEGRTVTRVDLNRDHCWVRSVLSRAEGARKTPRFRIQLPPGAEPVSETLIRERR